MTRVDIGKQAHPTPSGREPRANVDVMKVLDRIAAALAALDSERAPKRRPVAPGAQPPPAERKVRLRHNWG